MLSKQGAKVGYGPELGFLDGNEKLSFGDFGLLLILAFVAGHLVRAFGNLIEKAYWTFWGGIPSDWLRSGKHYLLAPQQFSRLPAKIREVLGIDCPESLKELSRQDWYSITRQVYAALRKAGQSDRVDIFNGSYGLLRGILSSLFVLIIAGILKSGSQSVSLYLLLAVIIILALHRMHRFGVHYARELFVEFLNIHSGEEGKAASGEHE